MQEQQSSSPAINNHKGRPRAYSQIDKFKSDLPVEKVKTTRKSAGRIRSSTMQLSNSDSLQQFSPATHLELKEVFENSFGHFRQYDTNPKTQRKILYALNQRHALFHKGNTQSNKTIQDIQQKQDKSKRIGFSGKLNAFLRSKKQKRTRTGILHSLMLSIRDFKSYDAAILLEMLSDKTLIKKNSVEAKKVFLMAMTNKMQGICLIMLEKGFPTNVNAPILGSTNPASIEQFAFPTFFQLAIVFELVDVIKAMLKLKADVHTSWYQITPLQSACMRGNEQIVSLLLEHGADINQMLSLTDFFLFSHLKHQHPKAHSSPLGTPDSGLTPSQTYAEIVTHPSPDIRSTDSKTNFNFSRQVGQRGPIDISKEYTNECQIFIFELAYICGHHDLSVFLIELYLKFLTRTNIKTLKASKIGMLICEDFVWLKMVLKAGASTDYLDPSGCSVLHLAARRGNLKVVVALLAAGMDINQKGHNGWYIKLNLRTALHEAVSTNSIDVIHYLIYKGADLSILTTDNKAAKDIALEQNYDQIQLDQMFSNQPNEEQFLSVEKVVNEYKVSETASQGVFSPKAKVEKSKFSALSIFNREKTKDFKGSNDSISSTKSSSGRRSFFGGRSNKKD